jgi:hypothetical protein
VGSTGWVEIHKTADICTGIWIDSQAIWVATTTGSEMSPNAGWTWISQPGVRAVNAGLYDVQSLLELQITDPTRFQDDVQYPLQLTNRGLLKSPNGWNSVFELKDGTWQNGSQVQDNDAFTRIDRDTRYAISPNGLFLLDNSPTGNVVMYFNVWNTAKFKEWCASNSCSTCNARYCNLVQDPVCQIGSVTPIPITPITPVTPTPPTPSKPFPLWIIGLIAWGLIVAAIIAAIVLRNQKKVRLKNRN